MIHYVIEAVDAGAPIVVDEIHFQESDRHDRQGFVERFHQREHVAIVEGTRRVVEKILSERK
jgi:phosphoribosylglycinamide formyltransferase